MTLQEALSTGGMVTFTGLLIVFAVLIILMLVMMAMKKVFYKEEKPKQEKAPAAPQPMTEVQPAVQVPQEDPNLIAVLTAAVAASLNTSTYKLNIKSYRRVSNNAPAWNRAGINEIIDSRF